MNATRRELSEGISVAKDWEDAIKLTNLEVEELLLFIKSKAPTNIINKVKIDINSETLHGYSRKFYDSAIKALYFRECGNAMKDIYDFIYVAGFGDKELSVLEWLMLINLVEIGLLAVHGM